MYRRGLICKEELLGEVETFEKGTLLCKYDALLPYQSKT
jgi:hypothetical protein